MEEKPKYQVAVIVYTYNSDFAKTQGSLRSAILQTGVKHQIVVADDGSVDNHRQEIEELFHELHFSDYCFSILDHNRGITENLRQASLLVDAEFIKILSPGDYLSESDVLAKLYSFANKGKYKVCFGDAIFYRNRNGVAVPLKNHTNAPALLYPYDYGNKRAQFRNCLMVNDFILGASVFTEAVTYKKYINRLAGHVKYFEDNALRLMIYDGIIVRHFPETIMWYEYGDGISTSHSDYWMTWLRKDYAETNRMMMNSDAKGSFIRDRFKMAYSVNGVTPLRRLAIFPDAVLQMIRKNCFPHTIRYKEPGIFLKSIIEIADDNSVFKQKDIANEKI